jgi:hypothetical protein
MLNSYFIRNIEKMISNNIQNKQESNLNDVSYQRQSREEFLHRFRKYKAFYVNKETLDNNISKSNNEIFKP